MPKQLSVQVSTLDAVLDFSIDSKATGKQLFDLVTRTLGVREVWYFGLAYTDVKGFSTWLRFDKKVVEQGVHKDKTTPFRFRAKFYPEDVGDLIMESTQHLFFLQGKDDILCENIHCSPEASVLLASYALQAEYGDYNEEVHPPGFLANQRLLPQNVIDQYDLTPEQWEDRIVDWWSRYKGILREESELEYIKIAQDLDMFGINYFEITNKKGTQLWLGVDAFGLNIYNHDYKISPKISFPWAEIRNVEYHGKKFCIMPQDRNSPDFIFYVSKTKISDLIMQLCMGNHDRYMKRRKPDNMELQQMKTQAKEERARKVADRDRLEREKATRLELEREKAMLEDRLRQAEEEVRRANQARVEAEQKVAIMGERVKIAEEQAHSLTKKKLETEEEIRRVRASAVRSEEERMVMERKAMKAEEQAASLLKTTQRREQEADKLRRELERAAIVTEQISHQQMTSVGSSRTGSSPVSSDQSGAVGGVLSGRGSSRQSMEHVANGDVTTNDMSKISTQHESPEYIEQSWYLPEQLSAFKAPKENLRVEGRREPPREVQRERRTSKEVGRGEQLQATVVRQTSYKHTAFEKSKSGSTKSRIAFFEEL